MISVFQIIYLFTNLAISSVIKAEYPEAYDKEIYELSIRSPEIAIIRLEKQLINLENSVNVYDKLTTLLYMVEVLSVLERNNEIQKYIDRGLELSKQHPDLTFLSEFLGQQALLLQSENNTISEEAKSSINKAVTIAQNLKNQRLIAKMSIIKAEIYIITKNYSGALEQTQHALKIYLKYDDQMSLVITYNFLGIIYTNTGDYSKAIEFYTKALNLDSYSIYFAKHDLTYNIALTQYKNEELDKATLLFKNLRSNLLKESDSSFIALIDYQIANIYFDQNKLVKANSLATKSYNSYLKLISEGTIAEYLVFNVSMLLTKINLALKDLGNTKIFLQKTFTLLNSFDFSLSAEIKYLEAEIEYFQFDRNWGKAFESQKKVTDLRITMYNNANEEKLSQLKTQFNYEMDQEKLQFSFERIEFQKHKIQNIETRQIYLILLSILLIILIFLTYFAYRRQNILKRHYYKASITDDLTKVHNRKMIIKILNNLISMDKSIKVPLIIVMIDLDHFKTINDTFGHEIGNQALIHFAKSSKKTLSSDDSIGRIGGEEWLLLFPNKKINEIKTSLKTLRMYYKDISNFDIPKEFKLSFSSGVLIYNEKYENTNQLLSTVDKAMYKAKENGRNQDVYVSTRV